MPPEKNLQRSPQHWGYTGVCFSRQQYWF